jgi:hypothetical protein
MTLAENLYSAALVGARNMSEENTWVGEMTATIGFVGADTGMDQI